ncbi:MAG: phosphoglycolate phosphatase [Alphaproteobacteria bacterium]|nr:phosphoglycolate phosphatase [Alphaproteobacteria bacterium]
MPRTLLLDLDGTLVDSLPDLAASLNRVLGARGLPPFGLAEVRAMVGDGVGALLDRAFAARARARDASALDDFMGDYAVHLADATRPYPGVAPTLARLAAEGWRLAVCTNKPERLARQLLATLDLARHFAAIGGGDSFPVRKPDPAHVLATLAAAGGTPGRAVLIGDGVNDLRAARSAAIPYVFAAWGYGSPELAAGAAARAERFAELPGLIAGLPGLAPGGAPISPPRPPP